MLNTYLATVGLAASFVASPCQEAPQRERIEQLTVPTSTLRSVPVVPSVLLRTSSEADSFGALLTEALSVSQSLFAASDARLGTDEEKWSNNDVRTASLLVSAIGSRSRVLGIRPSKEEDEVDPIGDRLWLIEASAIKFGREPLPELIARTGSPAEDALLELIAVVPEPIATALKGTPHPDKLTNRFSLITELAGLSIVLSQIDSSRVDSEHQALQRQFTTFDLLTRPGVLELWPKDEHGTPLSVANVLKKVAEVLEQRKLDPINNGVKDVAKFIHTPPATYRHLARLPGALRYAHHNGGAMPTRLEQGAADRREAIKFLDKALSIHGVGDVGRGLGLMRAEDLILWAEGRVEFVLDDTIRFPARQVRYNCEPDSRLFFRWALAYWHCLATVENDEDAMLREYRTRLRMAQTALAASELYVRAYGRVDYDPDLGPTTNPYTNAFRTQTIESALAINSSEEIGRRLQDLIARTR